MKYIRWKHDKKGLRRACGHGQHALDKHDRDTQQQNRQDSSIPREGRLWSTKLLADSILEEKGEARIQKSSGPAVLPHPFPKTIIFSIEALSQAFLQKKEIKS